MKIYAITGNQELLKRRELSNLTGHFKGWSVVETIKLTDIELDPPSFLEEIPTIYIYYDLKPEDLPLLDKLAKADKSLAILVLYITETKPNAKIKTFLGTLGKNHINFSLSSKPWEATKEAISYVTIESKKLGLTWEKESLIETFVGFVGADLGVITFELDKLSKLSNMIDTKLIQSICIDFSEAEIGPLIQGVAKANARSVAYALIRIKKTHGGDSTMYVTRSLAYSLYQWAKAQEYILESVDVGAGALRLNPWVYQNNILPPAKLWGKQGLLKLTGVLATAERALLSGSINAWALLTAGLINVCKEQQSKPK